MYGRERGTRDPRGRGRGHGMHGDIPGHGWGGGWGGGGRRRVRRGDVRRAVLAALADGPANGYEVMGRLEARSGGLWRPSPGSVYPTLQMLEDEGLVRGQPHEGTRVYELTDAGAEAAEAGTSEPGPAPWDRGDAEGRPRGLRDAVAQVAVAARQVAGTGSPEQVDRAVEIVQRARKELYQLLAEG
jgi:DNA-binding PadR family transcriptional regulator